MDDHIEAPRLPIVTRPKARATGSKTYFTGKPCPKGHVGLRLVSNRACIPCRKLSTMDWKKRNAEHVRDYGIQWRTENTTKEQESERNRLYREANLTAITARERRRRARPDVKFRTSLYNSAYYARDPQRHRDRSTQWNRANPGRVRTKGANRRARERNAEGSHTLADILDLFVRQKGRCAYYVKCRHSISNGYHVDHIISLSKGGSNYISNIQLTCQPCNQRKHAMRPEDFARKIGLLV